MSWTIVVDPETLAFQGQYLTNDPPLMNWPGVQCTCEDPTVVVAVKDDDGTVTLVEDPTKLAQKTQAAWTALRTERNARLAASDWTQLQDTHLSAEKKSAWADYRQALRDLPDETTNPLEAEWPPVPGSVPVAPVTGSRLSNLLGGV